jgi:hypothetical protein
MYIFFIPASSTIILVVPIYTAVESRGGGSNKNADEVYVQCSFI